MAGVATRMRAWMKVPAEDGTKIVAAAVERKSCIFMRGVLCGLVIV